jgi:hypothetical protein
LNAADELKLQDVARFNKEINEKAIEACRRDEVLPHNEPM